MTISDKKRDREPPDGGQEAIHNAQFNTPVFVVPVPMVEEGQAADTIQITAQPGAGQAGTSDAGNRRHELLQEWASAHEYQIPDTQKYDQDRRFLMSSLSDLIVTTNQNQESLAEIAKRQQDAYKGTCNSEQVIHDMGKSLDSIAGELQNVNRSFNAASTSQANDINVLKAKVASPAGCGSDSQAGPSSPTWPRLRGQGQNKRAWADMSDDGSSRSLTATPGRGRGPSPPGSGRGRGFGRRNQYIQGRGYVQQLSQGRYQAQVNMGTFYGVQLGSASNLCRKAGA